MKISISFTHLTKILILNVATQQRQWSIVYIPTAPLRSTTEYFEKLLQFILGYRKFYSTIYRFLELWGHSSISLKNKILCKFHEPFTFKHRWKFIRISNKEFVSNFAFKWNFVCGIAKNVTEGLRWIDFIKNTLGEENGHTVNKEYYLSIMKRLREQIRRKRADLWK